MALLDQLQQLHRQSAGLRAQAWPVTVTLSTDTSARELKISGSPAQRTRVQNEPGTGYVQRTLRTFMVLRSQLPAGVTVAPGTQFTILADLTNPENVGTVWRIFDLGDSSAGSELRCVAFRLD